jgi:hypothetical protein
MDPAARCRILLGGIVIGNQVRVGVWGGRGWIGVSVASINGLNRPHTT